MICRGFEIGFKYSEKIKLTKYTNFVKSNSICGSVAESVECALLVRRVRGSNPDDFVNGDESHAGLLRHWDLNASGADHIFV